MTDIHSSPKLRALIIDDETDICYLLSNILRQKNIHTEFVGSLAEAEKKLSASPSFFFIFLDNRLPDGVGTAYIHKLKNDHPSSRIIMITAHDTSLDRHRALTNGVDYFIGKPFTKEVIFQTVDKFSAAI